MHRHSLGTLALAMGLVSCSSLIQAHENHVVHPVSIEGTRTLTYAIVDTGQTKLFDQNGASSKASTKQNYPGQDGAIRGNQASYTDNGDGTITDNVTGLMWQKDFGFSSWSDAESYAQQANIGGHDDWRVPTIKELYSLMDFSGNQGRGMPTSNEPPSDARPFLDADVFDFSYPDWGRFIDVQFITSTSYVSDVMNGQACFFGVNFADGRIKCYPKVSRHNGNQWHLRLVRGNPDYGKNDFHDNGDGTVSDHATGLMWTQADSGEAVSWQQALKMANGESYSGYSDWRLPNAKELQSIVDYSRSPDTTGTAALDAVFSTSMITNMAGWDDFPTYWSSTSFEPGRHAIAVHFGRALGYFFDPRSGQNASFMDVHGAGSQRTNPKVGQDSYGRGPQGDVQTVTNHVRLVRDISSN